MIQLDSWLTEATRGLAAKSALVVRGEIQAHYESTRETAISGGATADEADRSAVVALGDPQTANCQYRQVLLTSSEARMLREGLWEARAICARSWVKWAILGIPAAVLIAAAELFFAGAVQLARVLLAGGIGLAVALAAPFLPIYTPQRARVYRVAKWVILTATLALALGPNGLKWSWLFISCLWPVAYIEWTRISIRRKLRVADWPKHLYL